MNKIRVYYWSWVLLVFMVPFMVASSSFAEPLPIQTFTGTLNSSHYYDRIEYSFHNTENIKFNYSLEFTDGTEGAAMTASFYHPGVGSTSTVAYKGDLTWSDSVEVPSINSDTRNGDFTITYSGDSGVASYVLKVYPLEEVPLDGSQITYSGKMNHDGQDRLVVRFPESGYYRFDVADGSGQVRFEVLDNAVVYDSTREVNGINGPQLLYIPAGTHVLKLSHQMVAQELSEGTLPWTLGISKGPNELALPYEYTGTIVPGQSIYLPMYFGNEAPLYFNYTIEFLEDQPGHHIRAYYYHPGAGSTTVQADSGEVMWTQSVAVPSFTEDGRIGRLDINASVDSGMTAQPLTYRVKLYPLQDVPESGSISFSGQSQNAGEDRVYVNFPKSGYYQFDVKDGSGRIQLNVHDNQVVYDSVRDVNGVNGPKLLYIPAGLHVIKASQQGLNPGAPWSITLSQGPGALTLPYEYTGTVIPGTPVYLPMYFGNEDPRHFNYTIEFLEDQAGHHVKASYYHPGAGSTSVQVDSGEVMWTESVVVPSVTVDSGIGRLDINASVDSETEAKPLTYRLKLYPVQDVPESGVISYTGQSLNAGEDRWYVNFPESGYYQFDVTDGSGRIQLNVDDNQVVYDSVRDVNGVNGPKLLYIPSGIHVIRASQQGLTPGEPWSLDISRGPSALSLPYEYTGTVIPGKTISVPIYFGNKEPLRFNYTVEFLEAQSGHHITASYYHPGAGSTTVQADSGEVMWTESVAVPSVTADIRIGYMDISSSVDNGVEAEPLTYRLKLYPVWAGAGTASYEGISFGHTSRFYIQVPESRYYEVKSSGSAMQLKLGENAFALNAAEGDIQNTFYLEKGIHTIQVKNQGDPSNWELQLMPGSLQQVHRFEGVINPNASVTIPFNFGNTEPKSFLYSLTVPPDSFNRSISTSFYHPGVGSTSMTVPSGQAKSQWTPVIPSVTSDQRTGNFSLSLTGEGGTSLPYVLEVQTGVALSYEVSGQVRLQGQASAQGVQVSVVGEDQTVSTDANGSFQMTGLSDGIYQLELRKKGYVTQIIPVQINGGNFDVGMISLQAGDLQDDGRVDKEDYDEAINYYGSPGIPSGEESIDYFGDQIIDLFDLILIEKNKGIGLQ